MFRHTISFGIAIASPFSSERKKPRLRRTRLLVHSLEDRTVPTTITPTTPKDLLGSGSLRDAILQANADNTGTTITILLHHDTYTLTRPNTNGQENDSKEADLDIRTNAPVLIIMGDGEIPGSHDPDPTQTIIDANLLDRAFQIFRKDSDTTVIFKNLTIQGGRARDNGDGGLLPLTSDGLGGAILSTGLEIILDHVIVRDNQALGGNGANGIQATGEDGFHAQGGGLYLDGGSIELIDSEIRDSKAIGGNGGTGGAIGVNDDPVAHTGGKGGGAVGGGLFAARADVALTSSIITSNRAIGGVGGEGGNGDIFDVGTGGNGGLGGEAFGGGLHTNRGTVTISSSTISKNKDIGGRGGEGGIGKSGGHGGNGGIAYGGGLSTFGSDALTLTDTDLVRNVAQGGEAGEGQTGTESKPSGPDSENSGLLGQGGNGGIGGAGWGGGLYTVNANGPIAIIDGQVKSNKANGGHGGNAGHGASLSDDERTGSGGAGGTGGLAQGGGLFIGAEFQVTINTTQVSGNNAQSGSGGAGGDSPDDDDESAGHGGAGGAGGDSRGGGILFNLSPDTPVNLTMSPIFDNHALGGGGGKGGFGGSAEDDFDGEDDAGGDGGAGGPGGNAQGGGIFVGRGFDIGGILTLSNSQLTTNNATGGDGGSGRDGGKGESGGQGGDGGNGGDGQGGGLFADGGSLIVGASTLHWNKAIGGSGGNAARAGTAMDEVGAAARDGGAGGAGQGGGLFAMGAEIAVTESTIDNNEATGAEGGNGGKGGTATEEDGGDAGNGGPGGAGQGAGLYSLDSTTSLTNSTVSTNTARGGNGGNGGKGGAGLGGGQWGNLGGDGGDGGDGGNVAGGGIYLTGESLELHSVTITLNKVRKSTAGKGGQGGAGGFPGSWGSNGSGQPGIGGGVFNLDASVNSFNTLIANNTADKAPDFAGDFNIAMYNLLGIGDGSSLAPGNPDAQGNIVGSIANAIKPKLGQLTAINGGPTKTHALLAGSPAINMGSNFFSPGPTDQRGTGYNRIEGGTIDIGAFESKGRAGTK